MSRSALRPHARQERLARPREGAGGARAMRVVLHILAELDDSDLHWTLDAGRPLRVPRGGELLRQGQSVEHLYLVVQGELVVRRDGWAVGRLGPGDVVGEMALLRQRGSSTAVVAEVDALVLAVPQHEIQRKLLQDNGFSARLHRALCLSLADRLERTDARLEALGTRAVGAPQDEAELDSAALGGLALARRRLDWLLQHVRGG